MYLCKKLFVETFRLLLLTAPCFHLAWLFAWGLAVEWCDGMALSLQPRLQPCVGRLLQNISLSVTFFATTKKGLLQLALLQDIANLTMQLFVQLVLGGAPFDDAGIAVPIDLCSCLIFLSLLRLHGCPEPLLWAAVDVAASLAASVLPLAMGHNVRSWGAVSVNARQQAGTARHVTNTQHRAVMTRKSHREKQSSRRIRRRNSAAAAAATFTTTPSSNLTPVSAGFNYISGAGRATAATSPNRGGAWLSFLAHDTPTMTAKPLHRLNRTTIPLPPTLRSAKRLKKEAAASHRATAAPGSGTQAAPHSEDVAETTAAGTTTETAVIGATSCAATPTRSTQGSPSTPPGAPRSDGSGASTPGTSESPPQNHAMILHTGGMTVQLVDSRGHSMQYTPRVKRQRVYIKANSGNGGQAQLDTLVPRLQAALAARGLAVSASASATTRIASGAAPAGTLDGTNHGNTSANPILHPTPGVAAPVAAGAAAGGGGGSGSTHQGTTIPFVASACSLPGCTEVVIDLVWLPGSPKEVSRCQGTTLATPR